MNWVTIFSPLLLKGRLPEPYYTEWVRFTQIVTEFRQYTISDNSIDTLHAGIVRFVEHYEREYYQHDETRVSACRSTVHYLLHICQNIRDCGPPQLYWQFPAERACGIITQKAQSCPNPGFNPNQSRSYS